MNKILNKENISKIVMFPVACVKCHLGQDWYQCNFEVNFTPFEYYPDYMEVEEFIRTNIDGKELNIEEALKILYDFLKNNYLPKKLSIINHVRNCKTHFNVDVTIGE